MYKIYFKNFDNCIKVNYDNIACCNYITSLIYLGDNEIIVNVDKEIFVLVLKFNSLKFERLINNYLPSHIYKFLSDNDDNIINLLHAGVVLQFDYLVECCARYLAYKINYLNYEHRLKDDEVTDEWAFCGYSHYNNKLYKLKYPEELVRKILKLNPAEPSEITQDTEKIYKSDEEQGDRKPNDLEKALICAKYATFIDTKMY